MVMRCVPTTIGARPLPATGLEISCRVVEPLYTPPALAPVPEIPASRVPAADVPPTMPVADPDAKKPGVVAVNVPLESDSV